MSKCGDIRGPFKLLKDTHKSISYKDNKCAYKVFEVQCINCGTVYEKHSGHLNTARRRNQKYCIECTPHNIKKRPPGESCLRSLIARYKRGAKERKYEWKLTDQEARGLFLSNCYYCNLKPSNEWKQATGNGTFIYNGIDRLNNSIGYKIDNVVSCCKICNFMKSDMIREDFLNKIRRIYNHVIKM